MRTNVTTLICRIGFLINFFFVYRVVEKQKEIQAQNELALQRQLFANQRPNGQRRPVFNAANFNPNAPISQQFDQQSFNQVLKLLYTLIFQGQISPRYDLW